MLDCRQWHWCSSSFQIIFLISSPCVNISTVLNDIVWFFFSLVPEVNKNNKFYFMHHMDCPTLSYLLKGWIMKKETSHCERKKQNHSSIIFYNYWYKIRVLVLVMLIHITGSSKVKKKEKGGGFQCKADRETAPNSRHLPLLLLYQKWY